MTERIKDMIVRINPISDDNKNVDTEEAIRGILFNLQLIIDEIGYDATKQYLKITLDSLYNLYNKIKIEKDMSGEGNYDWYWRGVSAWYNNCEIMNINHRLESINNILIDFINNYANEKTYNDFGNIMRSFGVGYNIKEDEYI